MPTSFEEAQRLGAVNAALVVVRNLLGAEAEEVPEVARIAQQRARYCQLLAARMKLPHVERHRLALAAWLLALEGRDEIVRQLVAEEDLAAVLSVRDGENDESVSHEARVLSLVRCYELLEKEQPEIASDPGETRSALRKLLPKDRENTRLIGLFCKILSDEFFLTGARVAVGRVLIVDPEEQVAAVLSPPLTSEGYQVCVVDDVEAAWTALPEFKPDLIMAEFSMPLTSGVEFCCAVKEHPDYCDVPFLMLTSSRGRKAETDSLKAGADVVLTRPIDLELLFLRVGRLIDSKDKEGKGQGGADAERSGTGGSLQDMPFPEVVQIIAAGTRPMVMHLRNGDQRGSVTLDAGMVVDAKLGDIAGPEAFYGLMTWVNGSFSAHSEENPERTMDESLVGLLMEGSRRNDEGIS